MRWVYHAGALGIALSINTRPFELDDEDSLEENTFHCVRDREYVRRYWRILVQVDQIFKEFAGRFNAKTSPVQLYWHSFDLAVTRFSGRRAPEREGADNVTRELTLTKPYPSASGWGMGMCLHRPSTPTPPPTRRASQSTRSARGGVLGAGGRYGHLPVRRPAQGQLA